MQSPGTTKSCQKSMLSFLCICLSQKISFLHLLGGGKVKKSRWKVKRKQKVVSHNKIESLTLLLLPARWVKKEWKEKVKSKQWKEKSEKKNEKTKRNICDSESFVLTHWMGNSIIFQTVSEENWKEKVKREGEKRKWDKKLRSKK